MLTFRDVDPEVAGVGLMAGGTIRIELPEEFKDQGVLPVRPTGSAPDCAPPLISGCSSAIILQGWPQSPVLPFPDVDWDSDSNILTLTAVSDWLPAGVDAPGPKQVHLQLFGFVNPKRSGRYEIGVEIKPDPSSEETLQGSGSVKIKRHVRPSIRPNSLANGAPPPPFPNTLFQYVQAGDTSLTMTFYLWKRGGDPYLGVDFPAGQARIRPFSDADGKRIGWVSVLAPRGAKNWSLESGGPSAPATAFITGLPTGRMTAALRTDPDVDGTYRITFKLHGGRSLSHVIRSS